MKKIMAVAMATFMTLTVSVSVYAYSNQPSAKASQSSESVTTVHASAQGRACTHVLCPCKSFRNGGASGAQCANCGHMEYIHK